MIDVRASVPGAVGTAEVPIRTIVKRAHAHTADRIGHTCHARDPIGAGVRTEVRIKGPVLLHEDHHMADLVDPREGGLIQVRVRCCGHADPLGVRPRSRRNWCRRCRAETSRYDECQPSRSHLKILHMSHALIYTRPCCNLEVGCIDRGGWLRSWRSCRTLSPFVRPLRSMPDHLSWRATLG